MQSSSNDFIAANRKVCNDWQGMLADERDVYNRRALDDNNDQGVNLR